MLEIKSSSDLDSKIGSTDKLVVMFSAPWCGPCKAIKPALERLTSEVNICCVNVEDFHDPTNKYIKYVQSLPTFLAYKNGLIFNFFSGANLAVIQSNIANLGGGGQMSP